MCRRFRFPSAFWLVVLLGERAFSRAAPCGASGRGVLVLCPGCFAAVEMRVAGSTVLLREYRGVARRCVSGTVRHFCVFVEAFVQAGLARISALRAKGLCDLLNEISMIRGRVCEVDTPEDMPSTREKYILNTNVEVLVHAIESSFQLLMACANYFIYFLQL